MKKIIYIFGLTIQAYSILVTIANLIYCAVVDQITVFTGTIHLLLIPYTRYCTSGNFFELIVLFIFLGITVSLFFLASKDFLNPSLRKMIAIPLNQIWYALSAIGFVAFTDLNIIYDIFSCESYSGSIIFACVLIILTTILLLLKTNEQQNFIRQHPDKNSEEFLPEKRQTHAISYRQIRRTALGTPVFVCVCLAFSLWTKYLNGLLVKGTNDFVYALVFIVGILLIINTVYETYSFEKRTGQKPPTKNFLMKLNIIQVCSMIFLVLSYLLVTFVF